MHEWSTLKKLIWLRKVAGGGVEWDWETVSGSLPLSLDMALKKGLQSLTQYGAISQASTPSPSSPQEIVCNNGALRMVDDELPAGYKRLLGLTYNNNVYYGITNFKMRGSDTLRFSFKCTMGTPACNVLGAYDATSAQTNYSLYLGAASSAKYLRYNGSTYNSQADQNEQYDVVITPTGSTGMKTDSTWTEKTFESDGDLCIGTTSPTATSSKMVGDIIGNIQVDGRLKLVPCERMSDNVLGYYDLVGETFYEPTGSGVVSMGYDGSHYSLQIVGTAESLTLGSQSATAADLFATEDYADEQEIISGAITRKVGVVVLDGTETGWALSDSGTTHRFRGTKPDDCYTPSSRAPITSTHFKYNSTGQATGGAFIGASTYWYFIPSDQTITTEDAWKAWLAAQYAAGTPVIVIYPLATETTESVTAQPLSTAKGDNTLTGTINVTATFEAVYAKESGGDASPIVGTGKVGSMKI